MKGLLDLAVGGAASLPPPKADGPRSVEAVLAGRRSCRHYADRPLALAQVGQLLWSAQGQTDSRGLRAAPSAGACYPLELDLAGAQGVFRYLPDTHALRKRLEGDLRRELAQACLAQAFIGLKQLGGTFENLLLQL